MDESCGEVVFDITNVTWLSTLLNMILVISLLSIMYIPLCSLVLQNATVSCISLVLSTLRLVCSRLVTSMNIIKHSRWTKRAICSCYVKVRWVFLNYGKNLLVKICSSIYRRVISTSFLGVYFQRIDNFNDKIS